VEVLAAGVDGWVEMEVNENNKTRTLGLSDVNVDASRPTIDYGLQLGNYTPIIQIYENDTYVGYFGHYQTGDVFRIERVGTAIQYKMNGSILHTSAVPSTTSLIVDVCLVHTGGTIYKPRISFGQGGRSSSARMATSEAKAIRESKELPLEPYPNPVTSQSVLTMGIDGAVEGDLLIQFQDVAGRTEWEGMVKGASMLEIDMAPLNLPPGIKILRVVKPDRKQIVKKILKVD
jgi:hypothetical protein